VRHSAGKTLDMSKKRFISRIKLGGYEGRRGELKGYEPGKKMRRKA